MASPAEHRTNLHSTNQLERLNREVKRRADVVGIFPNEDSIIRLIGAVLFEQNEDRQGQYRYVQLEALGLIDIARIDPLLSINRCRLTVAVYRPYPKLYQLDGR